MVQPDVLKQFLQALTPTIFTFKIINSISESEKVSKSWFPKEQIKISDGN